MDDAAPARRDRTPGAKFLFAGLIGLLLAIPLFSVYLLVYDKQSQSETARASIAEGWGGPQTMAGPFLVIPYLDQANETVTEAGRQVTRSRDVWRELVLSPQVAEIGTQLKPERRQRSIYEAVVYEADVNGRARFALPADLARYGVSADRLAFDRAELRFGLSDARGLFGAPPRVSVGGAALLLQPGKGPVETGGSGFYAPLDASPIRAAPLVSDFAYAMRGNAHLTLAPQAGDTRWTLTSAWPHPSFQGGFLPATRKVDDKGFTATYRLGNLALGKSLVEVRDPAAGGAVEVRPRGLILEPAGEQQARVTLVQPVDLYSQVNRAVKYGFLFIGFTFLTFLMFDVIGGVTVASVEYLLVGVGLVLFFVLLLAFAEVIGFTAAYLLASAAIIGQIAAYSAAVLKSWRRAAWVGGLLAALYAVLYILLSLEAYSLLIGSVMLFVALGVVMYVTRRVDWTGKRGLA
ncbi:cell envelope integrity protein CreD [Sphingomonas sp. ID1715]|uniref:cell envelope integrity protein CreD n=1 Tax=Sphingomonas sp. ID1715 TaxID=1656898 RepID=UPI00148A0809|nr:cell envelope integrity protein CreD [Sphingomonas sp. ID1715]NNM78271.1 cell envelope integrity protein CreD [Sphingomonas sp. ID1715]